MLRERRAVRCLLSLMLCLCGAAAAHGQLVSEPAGDPIVAPSIFGAPGSLADERLRLGQLLGASTADGYLIRSPSSVSSTRTPAGAASLQFLPPQLLVTANSALPFSLNHGELWAGKGWSSRIRAGARLRHGPVDVAILPEVVLSENRDYFVLLSEDRRYSGFVPSWYTDAISIDLPLRFGDAPLRRVSPGQSSLTVDLGGAAIGAATEEQWWGPG